jgi:hypothetical protein
MNIEIIVEIRSFLGVSDNLVLVGCGTDGASANKSGMRSKLQAVSSWLFWAWCYSHRLELACKDAFTGPLFHDFDDMLLQLYYLCEKSPEKEHDLSHFVTDLKEVHQFPDGGNLPVCASGSQRNNHKRKAV